MGRPVNPDIWATTTNYPAGAEDWAGTPTKVLPVVTFLTPGDNLPADYVNYLLNRRDNELKAQLDYLGQLPAKNWVYESASAVGVAGPFSEPQCTRPFWNDYEKCWLVGSYYDPGGGSVGEVFKSYDDGRTWQLFGSVALAESPSALLQVVAVRPSNGRAVILTEANTYRSDGTTWTGAAAPWSSSVRFTECFYLQGFFMAPGGQPGTGKYFANSSDGASWGNASFTGSSITAGAFVADVNSAGTLMVAFPRAGVDSGPYATWDGTLSTGVPLITGRTSPVTAATGLAWDPVRAVFVLTTTVSGDTIIRTSPDGITWTTGNTMADVEFLDLKCLGALWVASGIIGGFRVVIWTADAGVTFGYRRVDKDFDILYLGSNGDQLMGQLVDGTDNLAKTRATLSVGL